MLAFEEEESRKRSGWSGAAPGSLLGTNDGGTMADEMKRLRLQMKKTVTLILFTLLSITAALAKDKYANATFKQGEVTSIQTREIARGGNGAWNVHNVPT